MSEGGEKLRFVVLIAIVAIFGRAAQIHDLLVKKHFLVIVDIEGDMSVIARSIWESALLIGRPIRKINDSTPNLGTSAYTSS